MRMIILNNGTIIDYVVGEEYPISELHKEVDLGYLCQYCEQAIKSRGEKLIFEE